MNTSDSRGPEPTAAERYTFGDFRLEGGPRQVVTKDELISEVWRDTFVSEDSLTQNISVLRRVLEDDAAQPKFIATVARRGS